MNTNTAQADLHLEKRCFSTKITVKCFYFIGFFATSLKDENPAMLRLFDIKVLPIRSLPAQNAALVRLDGFDRITRRKCADFTF